MGFNVRYTFDIGEPGSKIKSGDAVHQTGDFAEFAKAQLQAAEQETVTPSAPVVVEVFVDDAAPIKMRSNAIGEKPRAALIDALTNEHQHRAGLQGTEGKSDAAEMAAHDVAQPVETDGDQGAGNNGDSDGNGSD